MAATSDHLHEVVEDNFHIFEEANVGVATMVWSSSLFYDHKNQRFLFILVFFNAVFLFSFTFFIQQDNENTELPDEPTLSLLSGNVVQHGDDLSKMDIHELTPYPDRFFANSDDAYNYYNAYAFKKGFGIRKATSGYSRSERKVIRKVYVCDREGQSVVNINNGGAHSRPQTRLNCKAMMAIVFTDCGRWKVSIFRDEHTHGILSPAQVRLLYSHNYYHRTEMCKKVVKMFWHIGIRPSMIKNLLNISVNGEAQRISTQQVCDITRDFRNQHVGSECTDVVMEFYKRKSKDSQFNFSFWADSRCRRDYLKFSDVVVFDVTYRTNRFALPFVPFTGVNHH